MPFGFTLRKQFTRTFHVLVKSRACNLTAQRSTSDKTVAFAENKKFMVVWNKSRILFSLSRRQAAQGLTTGLRVRTIEAGCFQMSFWSESQSLL